MQQSGVGEQWKDTKLLKNKKERCEVSKATLYFLDIIIKNIFFLFQVSPVAEKGNIVLIYKVNTVYRNVRENGYTVNYTFLSGYTPQFPLKYY